MWIPLEEWQKGARKVCPPIPASPALTESQPSFIQVISATWCYSPKHGQELFVLPLKGIFRNLVFLRAWLLGKCLGSFICTRFVQMPVDSRKTAPDSL